MSVTIAMPQLGLTMTEGTVSSWQKKPGERVQKDEIVLVISTDKVDMDVEAPEDGTLEQILVEPGTTVPVGTPLAYLRKAGEEPDTILALEEDSPADLPAATLDPLPSGEKEKFVAPLPSTPDPGREDGRIIASPRAKRIAAELAIDLATVKGSGPRGRINVADVQQTPPRAAALWQPEAPSKHALSTDPDIRRRQIIAARMVESITTIPAFSVSLEVSAENLVSLYESLKEPLQREAGTKLTYTDLLLKALAIAAARTPEMNTLWSNGALRRDPDLGIGLAVATDRGVVAPVLKGVDRLALDAVARCRSDMTAKARQGRLDFEDLGAASGTLSNLGMYRVDRFQGIITPGQTYILAIGALRDRPWVDKTMVVRPTMFLTLSVDHRVADGAAAAVFLERIAEVLESPYQLLWQNSGRQ